MRRLNNSHRFMFGASVLALCAVAPLTALAQTAGTTTEDTQVEEIVVTGQRAQIQSAQKIKQNAEVIVDSITAVDIGALPDRSVSEALQRISGITLQRTNEARDPARMAAEGGGVAIRGLSWVRSETNGRDIFSAKNGRGLSFEDVSADLLAGVDVYKNPSADMIEGGIGGTVNLRTRVPFDQKGRLFAFSGDYNYGELQKKGYYSGNVIASDRWDTNIGEFGALLAYSYSEVGNRTNSISVDRYDPMTVNGSTVYVPKAMGWRSVDWEQKRQSLAFAAQWRPNDKFEFTLQAMGSKADPKDLERAALVEQTMTQENANGYTYNSSGVFTGGTVNNAYYTADTRAGEGHKKTGDIALNGKWFVNDAWTITGDLQYVKSTSKTSSLTVFTQLTDHKNADGTDIENDLPDVTWDLTTKVPTVSISGLNNTQVKSEYYWAAAMDHIDESEASEKVARLDATYEFPEDGWLKTFRFGVRATDKEFESRESSWNWSLLSAQYWGGGTPVALTDSATSNLSELYTFKNFFGGDVQVPGYAWFPSASVVTNGAQNAYNLLKSTETAGWGWSPVTTYADANNNNQNEKTYAGYGLLRFGSDTPFGTNMPLDGNIGLRIVKTEASAGAGAAVSSAPTTSCATGVIAADLAHCNAAVAFGSGTLTTAGANNDYTDVLPSLNLRWHVTPQLQIRFAASKAVVRPTMVQLQPYTTLGFNFASSGTTATTLWATGTGGNPNLRPTKANQFDLSAEWYFAPTGSLTLALFRKNIKDYIYTATSTETYVQNGQSIDFAVTRYANGSDGSVQGFEIGYQQFYDFLPGALSGIGVQANYTFIDNEGGANAPASVFDSTQVGAANSKLPIEGMSGRSYNVAVMYEKYGVSARLAYNWRQRYLLTSSAANVNAPVWSRDYGQLDGSVFYSINKQYKVGVQATNILKERTVLEVGYPERVAPYNWVETDRRVAFAVRAAF
ncbi:MULTISPECIES: TonB-dependent receptor [unclassified Caulobacter]|uniref:TonB-dependent receptor n=1 Tax=unclassified Caulobacter TaxID=2648921 RepID=UPI0018EE569F|nr:MULTISPECIES: TonB-dependent receptor [unclassified Caulobacter]